MNFRPRQVLPADVLCAALARTTSFLQHIDATARLRRVDDWFQHDGLMFKKGEITFHELFRVFDTPRALLAAMSGDHQVRIGVAPSDGAWYLRFILDWDADDAHLEGEFDLTLPVALAEHYLRDVVPELPFPVEAEDATEYYRRIGAP